MYRRYLRQLQDADRVVAISETTAVDLWDRLGVPRDRVDVVYPVVRASRLERRPAADPTFLAVGALAPYKQPELEVRALASFRARTHGGRLRFIVPARPDQARRIREEAVRLAVSASVSIEGRIPDDALNLAYASATAVLSTSRLEGFGLPPVEALVRGVPVIAVDTAAAGETLGTAAAAVEPEASAIAEAMLQPIEPTIEAITVTRRRFAPDTVGMRSPMPIVA